MIRRTHARSIVSSIAALTLVACQDTTSPVAPLPRAQAPRFSIDPVEQLDQANLTGTNWAGRGSNDFGQSFRAGKTGQLTRIEVQVICGASMPNAVMEVYAGSYNANTLAPNVAALIAAQPVSSSVWPACNPEPWTQSTREWITVAFDSPASVVAGEAYTFRMLYSTGTIWHSASSFVDLYPNGVEWTFARDWDAVFKTYVMDATPPVITPTLSGTHGPDDWFVSDVLVSWTVDEPQSTVTASSGCATIRVEAETNGTTYTCSATSGGGTAERSVTVRIDKSAPSLNPTVSPNPVVLGGTATVSPNLTIEGIGLASLACGDVITSSIGLNIISCSAFDLAGRGAVVQRPYFVVYPFTGFFAPVDAAPVLNTTKAGSAIPVKFSLGGNRGLAVMAADYPASQAMSCSNSDPAADLEETVTAGTSSLTYDALSARYTYVWKTDKSWAGTCRKLSVKLVDGSEHTAFFKFAK